MSLTSNLGLVTPLIQDILRSHFSGLFDSQIRDPEVRTKMVLVAAKAADVDVKLQAPLASWVERVCWFVVWLSIS